MDREIKIVLRKKDIFDLLKKDKVKGRINLIGYEYNNQDEYIDISLEVEQ